MLDLSAVNAVGVIGLLGFAAFVVSLITQLTKEIPIFKKIPTVLEVIVLSVVLCVAGYVAYCSYSETKVQWYLIFASVLAGFVTAYISMFGWQNLHTLWNRFKTGK